MTHQDARINLIARLAVVARKRSVPDLTAVLGWHRVEIYKLRHEDCESFGWPRLLHAADCLGVPVEIRIGEAA